MCNNQDPLRHPLSAGVGPHGLRRAPSGWLCRRSRSAGQGLTTVVNSSDLRGGKSLQEPPGKAQGSVGTKKNQNTFGGSDKGVHKSLQEPPEVLKVMHALVENCVIFPTLP